MIYAIDEAYIIVQSPFTFFCTVVRLLLTLLLIRVLVAANAVGIFPASLVACRAFSSGRGTMMCSFSRML